MLSHLAWCGIIEARRSGRGQVVDAAMTDGAASLTMFYGMLGRAHGRTHAVPTSWTGSHFYTVYETKMVNMSPLVP